MGDVVYLSSARAPERLLNLHELMALHGMSERWFRYQIADGMPCHRWGRRLRFRASEVEAWLDARYQSAERSGHAEKAR